MAVGVEQAVNIAADRFAKSFGETGAGMNRQQAKELVQSITESEKYKNSFQEKDPKKAQNMRDNAVADALNARPDVREGTGFVVAGALQEMQGAKSVSYDVGVANPSTMASTNPSVKTR